MTIKRIDNRNKYGTEYWFRLNERPGNIPLMHKLTDMNLYKIHAEIDSRICCTHSKKFIYGYKNGQERHRAVSQHNNNLSIIKQKTAMTLNWVVKHYNLKHFKEIKVGINYDASSYKYILLFRKDHESSVRFTFNDPAEIESLVYKYVNQLKLQNLLLEKIS